MIKYIFKMKILYYLLPLLKNMFNKEQLEYIKKNISGNKTLEFEDISNISIYNGLSIIHNEPKFISYDNLYKKYILFSSSDYIKYYLY